MTRSAPLEEKHLDVSCPQDTKLLAKYVLLRLYYLQQCVNKKEANLITVCEGLQSKTHSDTKEATTTTKRYRLRIISHRNKREKKEMLSYHEDHQLRSQRGATGDLGWVHDTGMHALEFVSEEPLQCNPSPQSMCGSGPLRLCFLPNPHILSAQHCKSRPCRWTQLNLGVPVCNKTDC